MRPRANCSKRCGRSKNSRTSISTSLRVSAPAQRAEHARRMPIAALIIAMCAVFASGAAQAQSYPSKPIRFIVPFPPGGGNDIVGRIVAQKLAEQFGLSVVVDNRGGAGGTVGTELAAKAPADGHTMLVNNISLAVNATLFLRLPYDTLKD